MMSLFGLQSVWNLRDSLIKAKLPTREEDKD